VPLLNVSVFVPRRTGLRPCEKEDLCRDIVKELGKREQKLVVALTSEQCKLLNDSAKSELRTMLGISGNESSGDASDDDESGDKDNRSSTNESKGSNTFFLFQ